MPKGHIGKSREREEEGWGEPGALPLLGSSGGASAVLQAHSLLANLKSKSGN